MPKWVYFIGKIIMVLVDRHRRDRACCSPSRSALCDLELPATAQKWLTFGWVAVLGIDRLHAAAASRSPRWPATARSGPAVVTPVALVLQFISGVFFVFTGLPAWMQQVAAIFPLKWMCQGLRSVFLPDSFGARSRAAPSSSAGWRWSSAPGASVGLVLCLSTFRWTTKRDG